MGNSHSSPWNDVVTDHEDAVWKKMIEVEKRKKDLLGKIINRKIYEGIEEYIDKMVQLTGEDRQSIRNVVLKGIDANEGWKVYVPRKYYPGPTLPTVHPE
jgi:hypothetical protein